MKKKEEEKNEETKMLTKVLCGESFTLFFVVFMFCSRIKDTTPQSMERKSFLS